MVRERRRLPPLAWEAASSLLLALPCCINPFEGETTGTHMSFCADLQIGFRGAAIHTEYIANELDVQI